MTRQEQCSEVVFSQHSKYLRNNPWLNSHNGHTFANIDYFGHNYKKNTFKIIEEKTHAYRRSIDKRPIPYAQSQDLRMLYDMARNYSGTQNEIKFKGVHLIEFENTSPIDGGIFLNKKPITESSYIAFMGDELPDEWYTSIYEQQMTGTEEIELKYSQPFDFDIRRSNLVYNETDLIKDMIMTKIRPLP